jgi:hypothetical protein
MKQKLVKRQTVQQETESAAGQSSLSLAQLRALVQAKLSSPDNPAQARRAFAALFQNGERNEPQSKTAKR